MYGYIYKTTNLINGKIYVGQKKASSVQRYYLGSGKHFKKAVAQYGRENFKCEVIETAEDAKTLDEREIYWIKYFNATNKDIGYNISEGGLVNRAFVGENNPMFGKHHSLETRKKISLRQIEHNKKFENNAKNPKTRKKLSEKLMGHEVKDEIKNKISSSLKKSVWITNGDVTVNVSKNYVDDFLSQGFTITKQPISPRDSSIKRTRYWVKYKDSYKIIDEKYLNNYLKCGYIKVKKPRRRKLND